MDIIWNKNELIKIERIILIKSNYELKENNELILNENKGKSKNNNFTRSKTSTYVYNLANEEIYKLFYTQDRQEITNIFNKLSGIEFDKKNPLHYGLIACLSKIDYKDYTYAFIILKEIISQFERTTSDVISYSTSSDEVLEKIKQIKNSSEETTYEKEIKKTMDTILNYAPRLREIDIYNSLIEKEYANIKNRVLVALKNISSNKKEKEILDKNIDSIKHIQDFSKKYQRKRLSEIKQKGIKFY